ncbi:MULTISPECIES: erythromycin resistance leader peptide [Bacillaceae]|nr:erythromycin resistance leader peptide [Heyndrickxia oleronia]NYV67889.1 erythromycin resistance leader peptide [Bacillus sp. Gen3]
MTHAMRLRFPTLNK